jgi:ATP-binding cassette, subfamily B, bacterial
MEDATLWEMGRRIPQDLAQTARLAWSVDRRMVITIMVCQLFSVIGTFVMLTSVSHALGPLLGADDRRAGLKAAWPSLSTAVVAMAGGAAAWILADWATRRLSPQIAAAAVSIGARGAPGSGRSAARCTTRYVVSSTLQKVPSASWPGW